MEDLNLLSENIINQILSKISQINWNEDQVDTILNQIKNQVSDKTESLIKNLIITNNLENINIDLVIKSDKEPNNIPEQKPTKELNPKTK